MFIHVFFLFPETAGKTLEEVKFIFEDPNGPPYVGTPAWKTHVDRKRILDVERHGSIVPSEGDLKHEMQAAGPAVERTESGSSVDHDEKAATREV